MRKYILPEPRSLKKWAVVLYYIYDAQLEVHPPKHFYSLKDDVDNLRNNTFSSK